MRRGWPSNRKRRVWVNVQQNLSTNSNNVHLYCNSGSKIVTLTMFQTETLLCRPSCSRLREANTILCWAAHPHIVHIWEFATPHPHPPSPLPRALLNYWILKLPLFHGALLEGGGGTMSPPWISKLMLLFQFCKFLCCCWNSYIKSLRPNSDWAWKNFSRHFLYEFTCNLHK